MGCPVRRLPLRDHFAEERERGGNQLTSRLCHTSSASQPLRLLLRTLLLRLVDRRMRRRTEQHLESPLELFDLDHAVIVADAPKTIRYRVPVRSPIPHLVPTDSIDVVVTVDKQSGSIAGIGAVLREPIPVLLGLVRITNLDVDLHINPDTNAVASDSEGVEPGSTARMTISKLGYSMQYNWSDFTRVPSTRAN